MNYSKDLPKDLQRVIDDALQAFSAEQQGLRAEDFTVYGFPQLWSSTALGHGGIGGQAMTTAQTWVIFSPWSSALVYFGGRRAYGVPHPSETFMTCVGAAQMPGRHDKAIKVLDKNGEIVYPPPPPTYHPGPDFYMAQLKLPSVPAAEKIVKRYGKKPK